MPVQIGQQTHGFSDPTGLLSDCHRRIEMFLGSLAAVGRVIDQELSPGIGISLDQALKYFREAAPKHTADEEASLFPRLRQLQSADVQAALRQLEQLEADHRTADELHATVDRLGQKYLAERRLSAEEVASYRAAVATLQQIYEEHIRIEDKVVFPLAKRVLPEKDKAEIAGEMAGRREARLLHDIDVKK